MKRLYGCSNFSIFNLYPYFLNTMGGYFIFLQTFCVLARFKCLVAS